MPVVLYHIVDSAVRSRKPIRIIEMDKAPHGGGDSNDTKVSQLTKYPYTFPRLLELSPMLRGK